jgi:hypothetical protein
MNAFNTSPPKGTASRIRFQVQAPRLGLAADISLSDRYGRWIARSTVDGRPQTAVGGSAREAVVSCLAWLGPAATSELLADLSLLDVSRQLHEAALAT